MFKINYNKQYIDDKDINEVSKALKSNLITTGPYLDRLEDKFKKYLSVKEVVACSSGTSAIFIAMKAIGVKKNDVVIMPSINFIASANMAKILGAKIFLCDIDKNTGQITPDTFKKCMNDNKLKKIKLVITMYLGGTPHNVLEFYKLKKKYKFFLIEDSCHSLGSSYYYKNKFIKIGSCLHSDLSTFSFHPVKTITSGEGGLITTRSKVIAEKLRVIRSHGIKRDKKKYWKYDIVLPSFNFRMSDINAALALSQLNKIDKFVKDRNRVAKFYFDDLNDYKNIVKVLNAPDKLISSYHLIIFNFDFNKLLINKEKLIKILNKKKIFPQYHYIPIYKFTLYKKLNRLGKFKNSESYYKSALSFPIYYGLEKKNLMKVTKCVKQIINKYKI